MKAAASPAPDPDNFKLAAVIEEERKLLAKTSAPAGAPIGLAFSGGGIRSATFNLGIIQALADCRLLSRFHYLSTVSGGGYIGSWLSALIHRSGEGRVERIESALAATPENSRKRAASCGLKEEEFARLAEETSYAIQYLRRYASYLTPRTGLFGLDTLTGVAIYLRNLQLNLGILFLTFIAVLLVPYLVADLAGIFEGSLALAVLLVSVCAFFVGFGMGEPLKGRQDRVAPWIACVAALAGCLVAADWLAGPSVPGLLQSGPAIWMVYAALINVVFWLVAGFGRAVRRPLRTFAWEKDDIDGLGTRGATFFIGAVVAGAIAGLGFYGFAEVGTCLSVGECRIESLERVLSGPRDIFARAAGDQFLPWISIEIFAPFLVLLVSMAVVLQIGIAKRGFSEHDREWLGRLGALLLKCCMVWVAAVGIVMLAPPLMHAAGAWLYSGGAAWIATTAAGLFAAKSEKTGAPGGAAWKDRLLGIVPYVFVAGLLFLLAWCLQLLLTAPFDTSECKPFVEEADLAGGFLQHAAASLCETSWTNIDFLGLSGIGQLHLVMFLSCLLAAYLLGWRFDINLFAFHQFYRNRLVRCFLGATKYARGNDRPELQRHPNEFTDLDPDDDLRLHELARPRDGRVQHPYHLVNTALNLANPRDLGWQHRKAASFVFSALFAGYELRYRRSSRGGYRRMALYGAGLAADQPGSGMKLGVPLAISGAAASPNQGYHTSPGLAFLMTVFNVRLGRWCGNTANAGAWRHQGPVFSNHYLFRELLANTNEASKFLYLSDGGHFENLGIYELVRRGCAVIVACDAGCDDEFKFEDLGNAIVKCEADLGVEISIETGALRPKERNGPCEAHFAVGSIKYPGVERPGTLIYIKSSVSGDETVDIQHYKAKHPEFPHQSTADQWFDEPQFESYRRLGHHIGHKVFDRLAGAENVDAVELQKQFPPTAAADAKR